MVAAILWLLLALEAAAYAAAGQALVAAGMVSVPGAVAVAVICAALLRAALVAFTFVLTRPPLAGLGFARAVRMFTDEWWAFSVFFVVISPLQPLFVPLRPPRGDGGPVVVLVHGIYCNAGVMWGIRRALAKAGVGRLYAVNLEPPFAGIDAFADQLEETLREVARAAAGAPITVVAHSMGGLVTRRCLQRPGAVAVRKVVSIATPYAGSRLARIALGICGADLREGSPFFGRLGAGILPPAPVVSIFSPHDNFVSPQASPVLPPPAVNYAVAGRGHLALLLDPDVAGRVVLEVLSATGGSRA
ncbi:MAG TPA: alpha/beta fold hydrolase [Pelomicrobium sp.]|nr:alpha/beta fold hydrolase [Pelomicrobium sp.]